jgi:hypothetical protein
MTGHTEVVSMTYDPKEVTYQDLCRVLFSRSRSPPVPNTLPPGKHSLRARSRRGGGAQHQPGAQEPGWQRPRHAGVTRCPPPAAAAAAARALTQRRGPFSIATGSTRTRPSSARRRRRWSPRSRPSSATARSTRSSRTPRSPPAAPSPPRTPPPCSSRGASILRENERELTWHGAAPKGVLPRRGVPPAVPLQGRPQRLGAPAPAVAPAPAPAPAPAALSSVCTLLVVFLLVLVRGFGFGFGTGFCLTPWVF